MPMKYKIDILKELKNKGYSSYRLIKENLFGTSTIQKFRDNKPVSWKNIEILCELLQCQPGDILEYDKELDNGEHNTPKE